MPFPLLAALPSIVAGGAAGLSYLSGQRTNKRNIAFQRETNQANTQFAWDMYNRQRRDSLDDWNRQNAYNSPLQQMQLLREAGLNPHMFYGKGAEWSASMIRGANGMMGNSDSPRVENFMPGVLDAGLQAFNSLWQGRQVQAQTDNLYAQNALINAQTLSEIAKGDTSRYDLDLKKQLRDNTLRAAELANTKTEEEIANLQADTRFTLDENERQKLANTSDIAKTTQEIIESKMRVARMRLQNEMEGAKNPVEIQRLEQEINNLRVIQTNLEREGVLKDLEAEMNKKRLELMRSGIDPNSPTYIRIIYELWKRLVTD